MHARRSPIWWLRGAALGLTAAVLLAGGGSLGSPGAEIVAGRTGGVKSGADSFRVQLYATTKRKAAASFRSKVQDWWTDAQDKAPEDVFSATPPLTVEHDSLYHRVRIGAFSSQAQARRARDFLREQYSGAFIVEEAPPPTSRGTPTDEGPNRTPYSSASAFRVQLYATTKRAAAESFRVEARRWWAKVSDEAPSDVFAPDPSLIIVQGGKYYRVRMGTFSARAQARRARTFLTRQYPDAFVVQPGSTTQSVRAAMDDGQMAEPGTTGAEDGATLTALREAEGWDPSGEGGFPQELDGNECARPSSSSGT
ncbi:MAG: SPOR domain-containing protein [Salinibacter sp.]